MNETDRVRHAIGLIDEANKQDPNREDYEGKSWPKELLYSERMTQWVERLAPEASEALRLATRAQHICRWKIARNGYPMNKAGYYKWRTDLAKFHADTTAEILSQVGYDGATIGKVRDLLQKKNLKTDSDVQTLEDAAALVFLEYHFAEFAQRDDMDEGKTVDIVRKTWAKMSDRGHEAALELSLSPRARVLIEKALS